MILARSECRREARRKVEVLWHTGLEFIPHSRKQASASDLTFILREPRIVILLETKQRIALRNRK